jgi:hypothetical protein
MVFGERCERVVHTIGKITPEVANRLPEKTGGA